MSSLFAAAGLVIVTTISTILLIDSLEVFWRGESYEEDCSDCAFDDFNS